MNAKYKKVVIRIEHDTYRKFLTLARDDKFKSFGGWMAHFLEHNMLERESKGRISMADIPLNAKEIEEKRVKDEERKLKGQEERREFEEECKRKQEATSPVQEEPEVTQNRFEERGFDQVFDHDTGILWTRCGRPMSGLTRQEMADFQKGLFECPFTEDDLS